jgi:hypothetical protein
MALTLTMQSVCGKVFGTLGCLSYTSPLSGYSPCQSCILWMRTAEPSELAECIAQQLAWDEQENRPTEYSDEEYDDCDARGMWRCRKCGHESPNSHDYCSPCEYSS